MISIKSISLKLTSAKIMSIKPISMKLAAFTALHSMQQVMRSLKFVASNLIIQFVQLTKLCGFWRPFCRTDLTSIMKFRK